MSRLKISNDLSMKSALEVVLLLFEQALSGFILFFLTADMEKAFVRCLLCGFSEFS